MTRSHNIWLLASGCVLFSSVVARADAVSGLEAGFVRPPDFARPWINWFWLDGNITREGITADLEAMQRVGLGGVLIMDVTQQIPPGPVRFGSPQWHDMFKHTLTEAARLGVEVNMHNAPGWCGSGGPWITPELAMQRVEWSKTNVIGPARFDSPLPRLLGTQGHDREIAVLAFPTLAGEGVDTPGFAPKLTATGTADFDAKKVLDRNPTTFVTLPAPKPGKPQHLQFEFAEPFIATRLTLTGTQRPQKYEANLQVSDDGRTFRSVREFVARGTNVSVGFEATTARYFRISFLRTDPALAQIELAEVELVPIFRIDSYGVKSGLGRQPPSRATSQIVPPGSLIPLEQIVDLSAKMNTNGHLLWDVPKGNWTILRFASAPIGTTNNPPQPEGRGLECDKLSKEALDAHFAGMLAKLIPSEGDAAGQAFSFAHIDSWEVGFQNWTPRFREEFQRLRGYDPLLYLPTFSGRVVANLEVSERFLWDVRRTIADLVTENYAGHLAELAHSHGLKLSIEAYSSAGSGPFESLVYAGRADMPMGEFWAEADEPIRFHSSRMMASAAHTYGKLVVAAEAFSAFPADSKWLNHPFSLKRLADAALCEGVNRLFLQSHALQPWLDRKPGMTFGKWGLHYDRTETWWEQSKPWHDYLARCQFLLQSGLFAADICYLTQESGFTEPPSRTQLSPPLPAGYDYDLASPEVVLTRMSVTNGRIVLPDGMSYRVLVLPPSDRMTPPLLNKIKDLVEAGATAVGPRPAKSPGLVDYPRCDEQLKQLADALWRDCDGEKIKEHHLGKGKVVWGKPLEEVLAELRVPPDFQQRSGIVGQPLRRIHRSIGDTEIYFVANPNSQSLNAECAFRVTGKRPEIWYPDSGKMETAAVWRAEDGRTVVPLKFNAVGSAFVVFRESSAGVDPVIAIKHNNKLDSTASVSLSPDGKAQILAFDAGIYELRTISGRNLRAEVKSLPGPMALTSGWTLRFPSNWGAPERVTLDKLISWTEHREPGVKYFSGTATYQKTIQVSAPLLVGKRQWYLDLGEVKVIAQVSLNGKELGILWKPPFRLDITDALKPDTNVLEVKVVNLWPNRLIGDEQLADDCRWLSAENEYGQPIAEWPRWLLDGKPSPAGRFTFTTWKHWHKDSPPLRSGLLGPVRLQAAEQITPQ